MECHFPFKLVKIWLLTFSTLFSMEAILDLGFYPFIQYLQPQMKMTMHAGLQAIVALTIKNVHHSLKAKVDFSF